MINRDFFFFNVRKSLFGGSLSSKPKLGLTAILDGWDATYAANDDRWLAYALGTAHHETDKTIGPIREYGLGKGHAYAPKYYGRGLVQLTWDYNYKKMSDLLNAAQPGLNLDLLANPDLALDLKYAVPIMFIGMTGGYFTGKKLADYFNATKEDWEGARKIINGTNKKALVADYAQSYYAALSHTT